jgi:hypothetical protein
LDEEFCHEEAYIVYKEKSTKQKNDFLLGFKLDNQLLMKTGTKRGFAMPKQVSIEVRRTKKNRSFKKSFLFLSFAILFWLWF